MEHIFVVRAKEIAEKLLGVCVGNGGPLPSKAKHDFLYILEQCSLLLDDVKEAHRHRGISMDDIGTIAGILQGAQRLVMKSLGCDFCGVCEKSCEKSVEVKQP